MRTHLSPKADLQAASGTSLPPASQLLAALTVVQHQQLLRFAERRLRRLATTPWTQRLLALTSPEDIVAETHRKVLSGELNPREGRVLSAKHRLNTQAFLSGLRSVINSEICNLVNLTEGTIPHQPLHEESPDGKSMELADPADSPRTLALRDLQHALFVRLRRRAQAEPDLLPVIDYWEPRFLEADRIAGSEFDQNLVYRVRQHARGILWELAMEAEPHSFDGREMLL
jgi:hypothetical protein